MATAESAGKICMVCGKDVTGQPRVKDASGRYLCAGECQQKALEAAKAREAARAAKPPAMPPSAAAKTAAPPPMEPGGLMGQLISDSPMLKSATCESCGNPMPGGAVLCTRCGFNTQTGKALKTAVIVEKQKKEEKVKGAAGRYGNSSGGSDFGPSYGVLLMIFGGTIGVLGVLGFVHPLFAIAAVALGSITLTVGSVWGLVAAFTGGEIGWGICSLLVPFAQVIYMIAVCQNKWAKAIYLGGLIGMIVAFAVIMGGIGMDEFQKASGV